MDEQLARTGQIWARLVRGHAALGRALSNPLQADHGLTVSQYAALLLLWQAERHQKRRVDLADALQLTPSGVTRLLDGMQRLGLVEKGNSNRDARVTFAVLTPAGERKLEEVSQSHRAAVRAVFGDRYSDGELNTLIELLGRLVGAEPRTTAAKAAPRPIPDLG